MELIELDRLEIEYLFSQFYNTLKSERRDYQGLLNKQVAQRLAKFMGFPQTVYKQFSLIPWELIKAMDIAFKPNLSPEEQLESIEGQPAFITNLIKLVNSSAFQNSAGSKEHIYDAKHAVTYLGRGAMKLVIPYFLLRKQASEEAKELGNATLKLWKETIGTAIYTSELAELHGHDQYSEAFATSVMIGLSKFIVGKAYLDIFEAVKTAYIEKARKEFNARLLDGIQSCKVGFSPLCDAIEDNWLDFSVAVSETLEFRFLPLHENLSAIKNSSNSDNPFIQTFQKGYFYNSMTNLQKNRHISRVQFEELVEKAQLNEDEFLKLRSLKMTLRRLFNKEKEGTKITDMIYIEKRKEEGKAPPRRQTANFNQKSKPR